MPATCLPTTGQLPASKTHRDRRWTFSPATDPTQPHVGTVTIVQGRRDVDSYLVAIELLDARHEAVLFAKQDEAAYVYEVVCERATGKPVKCSCDGFHFKKTCKHADAVLALEAADVIALPSQCP